MRISLIAAASALAVGIVSGAIASSGAEPAAAPAPVATASPAPSRMSAMPRGYLPQGAAPNSLLLNPAPPAPGSAAKARDEEAAKAAVALRGTPRWQQATIDADLFSPKSIGIFSCAAGVSIGPDTTPKLNNLLRRMGPDLALAVYPTKKKYMRARPFMENGEPTCTPQDEKMLRADGSYPSGHSALGWGWSLVLAEVVPDRAAELVARGRAFGDSRRICNVHWLSDIEEGRVVATAVVARLHAEPAFRADVEAARAEVDALRGKVAAPDCALENAALANN
jgi:acid phosphatase (class A)